MLYELHIFPRTFITSSICAYLTHTQKKICEKDLEGFHKKANTRLMENIKYKK